MKAGARGISIFFASGDSGVQNRKFNPWIKLKELPADDGNCWVAQPPASFPTVTAVGGTAFATYSVPFCYDGRCASVGERAASTLFGDM